MIQDCKSKDNPEIENLTAFLKVISEENRLQIIYFLQKNKKQCVCDIWNYLNLPQNLVSHHLKVLKDFGLLNSKREGLKVCYCVNEEELKKYRELLKNTLNKSGEKNGSE